MEFLKNKNEVKKKENCTKSLLTDYFHKNNKLNGSIYFSIFQSVTTRDGDKFITETELPGGNKSVRVYEFQDNGITVVSRIMKSIVKNK